MKKLRGSIRHQSNFVNLEDEIAAKDKEIATLKTKLNIATSVMKVTGELMETTETISNVKRFHELFGHSLGNETLTTNLLNLRINLIFEELEELAVAMGVEVYSHFKDLCKTASIVALPTSKYNETEVLDALVDLRYVLDGTTITCNLANVFYKAFEEIHNSNMSKAMITEDQIVLTRTYYEKQNIETILEYKDVGDIRYCVIKRASDNKILKNISYTPANVAQFLNRQTEEE